MKRNKSTNKDILRSSSAEYLTFVAATGNNEKSVEMRYEDENIWLTRRMIAELYGVSTQAIDQHIETLFKNGEIDKATTKHYLVVQNKLHFAVHRHTAAEIIGERANVQKEHMGLSTWENAPDGKIQKFDVSIAKNYLTQNELDFLGRLVSMYLDYAELQAERNIPMMMEDWAKRLDSFIEFNGQKILVGAGKISHEQAKLHAETQFEKYRITQDRLFKNDFDRYLEIEQKTRNLIGIKKESKGKNKKQ